MSPAADARTDLVRGLPAPAGGPHAGVVHAPGRPVAARVPGGARRGLHPRGHRRRRAGRRAHPAAGPPLRRRRGHPVLRHRRAAARHRLRGRRRARAGARWSPSPSAATADLDRLRPLEPEADAPYVAETVAPGAPELAGSGVALIGFAGAPFTVASYLVEGGPSRTFAKVKSLMHGEPDAVGRSSPTAWPPWPSPSLRAQVGGRGPGRPALRQLGRARSRPTSTRASSCPPPGRARGHRRPRRAHHPLRRGHRRAARPHGHGRGPTSSASTGGSRSTKPAGASGPATRVQGNLDPALCLAPWPVVEAATRGVLDARRRGTGTGHIFNLGHGVLPETDPGSWPRSSTWCTRRAGPG